MSLPGSSRKYRCWKRSGHGPVDMAEGVKRSCDIYFYNLAINLGIDRMYEAMTGVGLGPATGVDLPLEKDGLYPSREWKRINGRENRPPDEPHHAGQTGSGTTGEGVGQCRVIR